MEISAESLAANYGDASAITACVHEVAINRTDMCWFDSWLLGKNLFSNANVFKCILYFVRLLYMFIRMCSNIFNDF